MRHYCHEIQGDYGLCPYVTNVSRQASENVHFRTALWTGCHLQMTLMSIPVCQDVGLEFHKDTDQIIRIEHGVALVKIGKCKNSLDCELKACIGDTIFVPAGTWHNIINIGNAPLSLSSIYAPPHHPWGTVHHTKRDAKYME